MTGKTHRVGGMLCVLGGYTLLDSKGLLLGNVSPLVQLLVMYPFALYGSTVSDLDHNLQSIPSKDIISLAINKILHLSSNVIHTVDKGSSLENFLSIFNAKHRSWQTHSDLFLLFMLIASSYILNISSTSADTAIIRLVSMGLILGIISHLFLDMLTPEGIWCIGLFVFSKVVKNKSIPQKISLVPHSKFFKTGGAWESIVRCVMWVMCFIFSIRIVLSISPYSISFIGG